MTKDASKRFGIFILCISKASYKVSKDLYRTIHVKSAHIELWHFSSTWTYIYTSHPHLHMSRCSRLQVLSIDFEQLIVLCTSKRFTMLCPCRHNISYSMEFYSKGKNAHIWSLFIYFQWMLSPSYSFSASDPDINTRTYILLICKSLIKSDNHATTFIRFI